MAQGQGQGAMATHGMTENTHPFRVGRELGQDDVTQFLCDIAFHVKVFGPGRLGRIQIKTGARADFPIIRFSRNAGVARTGVHADQHQPQLGCVTLSAGLDHESFFRASESSQKEEYRHPLLSGQWRLVNRESHGQANNLGMMLIESLGAIKTGMLDTGFEFD